MSGESNERTRTSQGVLPDVVHASQLASCCVLLLDPLPLSLAPSLVELGEPPIVELPCPIHEFVGVDDGPSFQIDLVLSPSDLHF